VEVGGVKRARWFLPDSPDVLGQLRRQVAITIVGLDAFAAWSAGDAAAAQTVRAAEHRADAAKRELRATLRAAFVLPVEPEDVFALSRGVDWILNGAKDAIGESEVMACPPDEPLARMAALVVEALRHIDEAIERLSAGESAGEATDAAVKAERRLEKEYRAAMAALLEVDDLREVTARRVLYRRCSRIGEAVVEVAERVVYAELKQS
jgi:uncharacterized protein Yka (UPF0111/DUF47 family)